MTARTLAPALLGLTLAAASLAGCGKVGYLEQPAPLYGQKAKADFKARQAARAAGNHDAGSVEALPESMTPPEPGAATPSPPAPAAPPPPQ